MSGGIVPVMVGTAGHIDHGKSSLVRALTGVDPDRLKEERERGLTIDLGFAPLKLRDGRTLGMVDVPGHERFVKNMVAGSTALDLVVLVVAADDSVMPQTREHLEIVDVLGVRGGLIALTKVDLVDDELVELAEDEIRETVAGTVLAEAPILRVSTHTGEGVDAFRSALEQLALGVEPRPRDGPFRMALQRVFRLSGIGTVVTGIPISGSVRAGDEIELLPLGETVRVRGIQAFGGPVDVATAGHSTALSVPGAGDLDIVRGHVAAEPGVFKASEHVDVQLSVLDRVERLVHRTPIRFHTGTSEVLGVLSLLEGDVAGPGAVVAARVLLDEPVTCAHGDRFLLRTVNPPVTVGGGEVIRLVDAGHYRRRRAASEVAALLAAGSDLGARAVAEVENRGREGATWTELAAELAVDVDSVAEVVATRDELVAHDRGRRVFHHSHLDAGRQRVRESFVRLLRATPLAASVSRASLRTDRDFPEPLKDAVLDAMQAAGEVRPLADGRILLVERLRPLPEADQARLDRLVQAAAEAGSRPPTTEDLAAVERDAGSEASLANLIARAVDEGRLVPIGDHLWGSAALDSVLRAIRDNARRHDGILVIPELRDELDTTRKWLIPLLEHVDGTGLTRLRGGERRLLESSEACRRLDAADGAVGPGSADPAG